MARGWDIDFYVQNKSSYDVRCKWEAAGGNGANNPETIKANSIAQFSATSRGAGVGATVSFTPVGSFPGIASECIIECRDPKAWGKINYCNEKQKSPILSARLRYAIGTPTAKDDWGSPSVPPAGHPLGIKLILGDKKSGISWMRDNFEKIKDKKLNELCLPGTHDSATAILYPTMTDERQYLKWYESFGMNMGMMFGMVSDIMLGAARATGLSVTEQLDYGVRAFDFRMWPHDNGFNSVHRFLGIPYAGIVNELKSFLSRSPGELIYARFRCLDENHLVNNDVICKFMSFITEELGMYAVERKMGNPFERQYSSLVGQQADKAAVIIHFFEEEDRPPIDFSSLGDTKRNSFFTTGELNIVGDAKGGMNFEKRLSRQVAIFDDAEKNRKNCCLWFASADNIADATQEQIQRALASRAYTIDVLRELRARPMNEDLEKIFSTSPFSNHTVCAVYVDWIEDIDPWWIPYLIGRSCNAIGHALPKDFK